MCRDDLQPRPAAFLMMGSDQYCLKWNNHWANLIRVFNSLLQSETFVDVTLACEGRHLKAHRLVLSACSPYFKELLVAHPDKHPIVILKDVRYSELRTLIEFIYNGEVSVEQHDLADLLCTARELQIKGLADNRLPGAAPAAARGGRRPPTTGRRRCSRCCSPTFLRRRRRSCRRTGRGRRAEQQTVHRRGGAVGASVAGAQQERRQHQPRLQLGRRKGNAVHIQVVLGGPVHRGLRDFKLAHSGEDTDDDRGAMTIQSPEVILEEGEVGAGSSGPPSTVPSPTLCGSGIGSASLTTTGLGGPLPPQVALLHQALAPSYHPLLHYFPPGLLEQHHQQPPGVSPPKDLMHFLDVMKAIPPPRLPLAALGAPSAGVPVWVFLSPGYQAQWQRPQRH
ncbi:hypothetical protein C7M84_010624 [Penaeus vannamei]|uniref:BTB domain-containing protein n=1 Tax=Penaeus vannamei TaxID=6689 RepID=A0A423T3W8_PENVA|nr:hypothetical protein C7M84_010624 [Penaeus vannamei]